MQASTIRALLFDFDGVIVETETPEFQAWHEVYREFGQTLSVNEWSACIGTVGGFDPIEHLEGLIGGQIPDPDGLIRRCRQRKMELLSEEGLRPGISDYLQRAAELELSVAIVSSDRDEWIDANLRRVGHRDGWHLIHCANGDATRAKPDPCLYEEALAAFDLDSSHAIAFEDSPNGIQAAKAAGLYCVAVPNDVTRELDLSAADLRVESLDEIPLDDVVARALAGRPRAPAARSRTRTT